MMPDDVAGIIGVLVIAVCAGGLLWSLWRPDPKQPNGEPPDGDGDTD